ncbi:MAG: SGNH/GDSL hydrolase family protein [Chloroflexi bacterium]|nr:MAG: SGNH/GDSL hydrolase family protein [Chloroflexota bacterium]
MNRVLILTFVTCALLTACGEQAVAAPAAALPQVSVPTQTFPALAYAPLPTATQKPKKYSPITPVPTKTPTPLPMTSAPGMPERDPAKWKVWPVIPEAIDPSLQKVYERGLELGNDPRAFSLFGDCQARPADFFGAFETDPELVASLSPELQELVDHFQGSFNRESPTAQDATTPGSLLWIQWHRGEYGCTFAETPVECELRTHRPSFVIIQIGTHFESRNTEYLRRIILQLMDAGVVPILATKADNRENDERINRDMAMLAAEYDLPLWNFWAALSDLPERGLYVMEGREGQGPVYLGEEAALRHRMTGLEALNAVWRAVTGE